MLLAATIVMLVVGLAVFAVLASRRDRSGTPQVDGPPPPPGGGPPPPDDDGPAT